ncbi:hypothetical protein OHA84_26295 [Streptomyces sp. NBC_00513]|uniref:hypothetical protein n=1 Tax=unclassified Streptomyces TaxID=2593676 RepID=UPI00224CCEF6|nr:hypothetical protein [Streptomyces sp. NBC_00424]MCX5072975.1 hypothetical protein [Streptomyces sp. NBC_00424]WUD43730.1 hypothetical protein OHA84_26295 [Streptomyces sp. NBC_00513]
MFDSDISEDIAADLTADFSVDIEDDSGADHTRDFGADFARVLATDNTRDFGADFATDLATDLATDSATDKDLRSTRDPRPPPSLVRTGDGGAAFMFETQSGRESVREDRHSWL